ncbi:MAG: amidohydrolase family protein [Bacteroidia bacterium]|nr:amidohydrolase family protein [Bacteroidia bacterium]
MRQFSADYIFPINAAPIPNGVITVDDNGTITSPPAPLLGNERGVTHLKGILCPGFVNTHCHLELSHMKKQVSENKGMTCFIGELIGKRNNFTEEEIENRIALAEQEMICSGVVAVGDISNNNSTFKQKAKGNLAYHTFIEIFSLDPSKAEQTYQAGKKLEEELSKISHLTSNISISPHAPYTMSLELLNLINGDAKANNNIITIHNQESAGENELFESNTGVMYDAFKNMGINPAFIRKTGKNALESTLPYLKDAKKILLVHNTFTTQKEIHWIKSNISDLTSQIYFCTCPNANLYIENRLPDYQLFINENCKVTVGTDSLASNWSLSVLDELKTISKHHPEIELNTLLTWATKNGAEFLGFDQLGTFEKGKRPGLNLLKNTDGMKLTERTSVFKII